MRVIRIRADCPWTPENKKRSVLGYRLNQFRHRLTTSLDEVLWTPSQVRESHLADVNAKIMIKRREHFPKLHRTFGRFAAEPVGCPDHLSVFHAASGQYPAGNPR